MRRGVDCIVGDSIRASRPGVVLTCVVRLTASQGIVSRSASLLLGFGGAGVNVRTCFGLKMCRADDCIVGGSFRAPFLGVRHCVWGLGIREWVFKFVLVLRYVVRLIVSREARLGRRVLECVVASRFWGLGSGCSNMLWS